ncbi:MAG: ribosome biogenesis GTPase RsgA [Bacteroides sp. SM23_62_1]|nr:MAG: ribosome biogenesis GTPase RsgA [Bacteroides sp. SM23_62_1]
MALKDTGYTDNPEQPRINQDMDGLDIGRIIAEHKERYIVRIDKGEFEAEITGNMRFTAENRSDYPAVGDWVAVKVYDPDLAIIHQILTRKSLLERQAVDKKGEKQVIAANIDYAFIVQSADRDFNINRFERYLTICYSAGIEPIIVLSKTDLVSETELNDLLAEINTRIKKVEVIPLSNQTRDGYDKLESCLIKGKTYCFLGSSGVGKSTLINNLSGREIMKTGSLSSSTKKGKHTTDHRELIVLENGSMLIDNPGMREVGIADAEGGLETTFDMIIRFSASCRFTDCTHTNEKGCAVIEAVEKGLISRASYDNYLKMEKEKARFQTSIAEKRKKEKAFGKICKEGTKYRKERKY